MQVQYGTSNIPTATVQAKTPSGQVEVVASTGAGSVEAIFNTLEKLVNGKVHIIDYRVSSVSKGRDALGEAVINLSFQWRCIHWTQCFTRRIRSFCKSVFKCDQ